jgi:hypothetical protein
MRLRLLLLLLAVPLIAGCGGSDASADADAEAQAAAARERRQRLEKETDAPLAPVGGVDDLKTELAPDEAEQQPAGRENRGGESADAGQSGQNLFRTWTGPTGKPLAEGEFVSLMDGKLCLQKEDGSAAVLPLEALSQADREFIKTLDAGDLAADAPRGDVDAGADVEVEEAAEEARRGSPRTRSPGLTHHARWTLRRAGRRS